MANPEEGMYKEAMAAVQSGDRGRARDLFTRLLKLNQNNGEYWLWMSAMVETPRERTYCLQEVLRRDPSNKIARRGMQILGIAPPDEASVVPARLQRRNWQAAVLGTDNPEKAMAARNLRLTLGVAGGMVLVVVLAVAGILAARRPNYNIVYVTPDLSFKPSATFLPTNSPVVRSPTPTFIGPTPLWMQLQATYTPTPLYVNTPHPAEAYRIAMRAYGREDWSGAEAYLFQVATLQPNQPDLLYLLGETNRLQGLNSAALGYYAQAISADPAFAPAYLGRARVRLAEDPTAREEPLKDLKQAVELDPNLAEAIIEQAALAIHDRQYPDALLLLESAARLLPDSPLVAYYRAQALLRSGRFAEALDEAQRANQLDLTMLPAYLLLGEARIANQMAPAAIKPLKTYLLYLPEDAGAYVLLAQAYEETGDQNGALQAYDQALALDPRLVDTYLSRGELYYRRQAFDLALDDFRQAYRLDKNRYDVVMDLGRTYFQLQTYGDAYLNFEYGNGLAETDGQKAEVLYWRGQSLENLGEIIAALRDYKALLDLPPDAADPQWVSFAATQVASLATPTNTPVTPTLTRTPRPTNTPITPTITRTRQPTRTSTPTRTLQHSKTLTPSPTR